MVVEEKNHDCELFLDCTQYLTMKSSDWKHYRLSVFGISIILVISVAAIRQGQDKQKTTTADDNFRALQNNTFSQNNYSKYGFNHLPRI
jgi:hypothetical protein